MSVRYQLVIDCADPDRLAHFWAAALGYRIAPPPPGFDSWLDYYRFLELPENFLIDGADRISDPDGEGPGIWFQVVPEAKSVKNRLHIDVRASGDQADPIEIRRERIRAEAARLAGFGATFVDPAQAEGDEYYAIGMRDPEGNEFDIN